MIGTHRFDERVEFVQLVFGQRLGGEEIEGAGAGVGNQSVEHRQVVAERLAAGGGSDHDDVTGGFDRIERFGLVAIELFDAALGEDGAERGREGGGKRGEVAFRGGR